MAVTWAEAKARLRLTTIKDKDGKKWSDDVLLAFANLAIDDLSGFVPLAKTDTPAVTGGSDFALPDDLRVLESVVWSDGKPVPALSFSEEIPVPITTDTILAYLLHWPEEGKITFTRIPTLSPKLYYGAYRPHVTDDADELPFGPFRWMEGALYCYVAMLANLREGVTAAMLEQFKVRNDLNVGNPLNNDAREWWIQYRRIVDGNAPK